ncbi:hypothetical protein F4825DRAFT_445983 [Nemania diffusa]|nr:hypothetical protein F4825DRAFT_445983 [Nemania diffusa]
MEDLVPQPQFGALWSEEDEAGLASRVDLEDLQILKPENVTISMIKLWKVSLRIWRRLPPYFICRSSHLVYAGGAQTQPPQPDSCGNLDWDDQFCSILTKLLTHPAWYGQEWFFVAALQLAVICRTDDRRPWPLALNACPDPFCATLQGTALRLAGSSIRRIFDEAVEEADTEGQAPSQYRLTLSAIVDSIARIGIPVVSLAPTADLVAQPYAVTAEDLSSLVSVLDALDVNGVVLYYDCQTISRMYWASGSSLVNGPDLPLVGDMPNLLRAFLMSERREDMIARRLQSPQPRQEKLPQTVGRKRRRSKRHDEIVEVPNSFPVEYSDDSETDSDAVPELQLPGGPNSPSPSRRGRFRLFSHDSRIEADIEAGEDAGVDADIEADIDVDRDVGGDAGGDAGADAGVDANVDENVLYPIMLTPPSGQIPVVTSPTPPSDRGSVPDTQEPNPLDDMGDSGSGLDFAYRPLEDSPEPPPEVVVISSSQSRAGGSRGSTVPESPILGHIG